MSKQDKHIDRIFQESFKNFESQPSAHVWNNIEERLQPKKKRVIPIWFRYAGIAAALVLAFGLGYWSNLNTDFKTNSVTNLNSIPFQFNISNEASSSFQQANELLNNILNSSQNMGFSNSTTLISGKTSTNKVDSNIEAGEGQLAQSNSNAFNSILNEMYVKSSLLDSFRFSESSSLINLYTSETNATNQNLGSLSQISEENKNAATDEDESLTEESNSIANRWFIKPVISPIFNAGQNASSALGQEVAANSSSGDLSFSYGMQVGLKLNNKWSLRTGINQVNTSYTTQNVVYAPTASSLISTDLTSTYGIYSQDYYNNNIGNQGTRIFSENGNITQQLGFIEVPLEIEYRILDGKLGINLSGGASTFLLTNNGLMLETNNGMTNIGESQNINQTSFSTNVGLGINYKVTKKLQLNVEPALKYQINTFNDSNLRFNPYFFGVYTGLQFQF
jgi:hypothetical protein